MSTVEAQLELLREQMEQLQQQFTTHSETNATTPMQQADETAPLHSLGTRPHYDWTPSEFHSTIMSMDTPLFTSTPLPESERKVLIDSYPPVAQLEYRAPATIPTAEKLMNRGQKMEDSALKHHQYRLSALFRPLDVLTHELLTSESDNANLERYINMLKDIRRLLLDLNSGITQSRNNIALRAVNPSFSLKPENDTQYTLPLQEFQATLIQQTATKKATREATASRRSTFSRRPGNFNASSASTGQQPSFFRSGPPMVQGGFNNGNNTNNNNASNFNNNNNNSSNRNNFRPPTYNNNNKKSNNNPFRQ